MPVYTYKGYDSATGASRKGKVDAESQKAARAKLKRDKIIVAEMKEEASLDKVKGKTGGGVSVSFSRGVGQEDIAIMTRQFATLQRAHVPLDESLRALTSQVENAVLRNTLSAVKDLVSEGKSLGDAMQAYPGVFNRLYVNMIRAGESSGTLGLVLERLSDFIEYQVKIRNDIVAAMAYPILMMLASFAVIALLFVNVVPKLQKVFQSLKVTLPWYTQSLINLSEFLQARWWLVLIVMIGAWLGFNGWIKTPKGRRTFDTNVLKMPIFGPIVMRINVSRFTRTLATLLNSGVPIIRALEITRNIVSNAVLADVVEQARTAVQEGQSLGATIERSHQFPPLVTHMIMTGERTGQLEEMLGHVATAYDAEVQRKINAMISLVGPVMIIVMVCGAGGILAALMIPMLGVMNQIR